MKERALNSWEERRERAFAQSHLLNHLRGSFISLLAKLANDLSTSYRGSVEELLSYLGGAFIKLDYAMLHAHELDFERFEKFIYGLELIIDEFLLGEINLRQFDEKVWDLIEEIFGRKLSIFYIFGNYSNLVCSGSDCVLRGVSDACFPAKENTNNGGDAS
jgi:hypothetical protein